MPKKLTWTGLVFLLVVLKLIGVIEWSWLWVLSPIWIGIPALVVLAFVAIALKERTE